MKLGKGHGRPTPAGWAAVQRAAKDLPTEVVWPQDQCTRCKSTGQMSFTTGLALCAQCSEQTIVQTASPLGLHERRSTLELQSSS